MATLDFDPAGNFHGPNVVQTGKQIENEAFALMQGMIERFRVRFANLDQLPTAARAARHAVMRDVVRELHGENSGSEMAREFAKGWKAAADYLRKMWNAAGGTIPELERWAMPQTHNARALAAIDEPGLELLTPEARGQRKAEIWADYITPLLDREAMLDFHTGQPLTDGGLRRLLIDTYKTIVTGGLEEIRPGSRVGGGFTGKRQQSRFLRFKDADSFLAYNERFGNDAPFDSMIHHVRSMSRDLAILRVLGSNPSASIHYAEQLIAQEAGKEALGAVGKKASRLAGNKFGGAERFRRQWEMVAGNLSMPGNSTFAVLDETNRNVLQSAILAGAAITAITDRGFTWATASLLDLPHGRMMGRLLKSLNPLSTEDQTLAARLGFGVDAFLGAMISTNRYSGEIMNPSVSRTLTDSVLRASGLVRLTDAGRTAFQTEFLGELTRLRGSDYANLPDGIRRGFKLHGVTKSDWDTFRAVTPYRDAVTGGEFIRPRDVVGDSDAIAAGPLFEKRFEVANRIFQMIAGETDFAIPGSNSRARADLLYGTRPGTIGGSIARNFATLKSFPVSLLYMHMNRVINADLPRMTRAKWAANLIISTTILGALAEQLSQISKGKDPLSMDDGKFWLKAASRGGGAGIFGDFIFSDVNRFGTGILGTFAGPVLGQEIPRAAKLTVGNVQNLVSGEDTHAGREIVDFARLMLPGRSLWYGTLAFDRLIFDQVQMGLDPDYAESFARQESAAMRDYGQEYFSPPGSGFPPPRAPDLTKALP